MKTTYFKNTEGKKIGRRLANYWCLSMADIEEFMQEADKFYYYNTNSKVEILTMYENERNFVLDSLRYGWLHDGFLQISCKREDLKVEDDEALKELLKYKVILRIKDENTYVIDLKSFLITKEYAYFALSSEK